MREKLKKIADLYSKTLDNSKIKTESDREIAVQQYIMNIIRGLPFDKEERHFILDEEIRLLEEKVTANAN